MLPIIGFWGIASTALLGSSATTTAPLLLQICKVATTTLNQKVLHAQKQIIQAKDGGV